MPAVFLHRLVKTVFTATGRNKVLKDIVDPPTSHANREKLVSPHDTNASTTMPYIIDNRGESATCFTIAMGGTISDESMNNAYTAASLMMFVGVISFAFIVCVTCSGLSFTMESAEKCFKDTIQSTVKCACITLALGFTVGTVVALCGTCPEQDPNLRARGIAIQLVPLRVIASASLYIVVPSAMCACIAWCITKLSVPGHNMDALSRP